MTALWQPIHLVYQPLLVLYCLQTCPVCAPCNHPNHEQDVQQDWIQYQPLGCTSRDWLPPGFCASDHNFEPSRAAGFQPTPLPTSLAPTSSFVSEDAMVGSTDSLSGVKTNNSHCSPPVHQSCPSLPRRLPTRWSIIFPLWICTKHSQAPSDIGQLPLHTVVHPNRSHLPLSVQFV